MIEAMACGTPAAAFPVAGPMDVLQARVGAMDLDLDWGIARALECERAACANYARGFSWERSARQFLAALAPVEQCMAA